MITITSVRIALSSRGKVRGYASITLGGCFAIHGLKIIEAEDGHLFTAMPSRKRLDGSHQDLVHPITPEARALLEEVVQAAYHETVANEAGRLASTPR